MFTQDHLQELLQVNAVGDTVVSVYLDTDTTQQPVDTIKLQVRGMLKDLNGSYAADAEQIEHYLDLSYDWKHPGLAMFSCAEQSFFAAYPAAISFRNRARTGHKPYVKPLVHLLDHYAYYGVIVIDRVGARFLEYHLGELQSTEGFLGEDVRKLKKGGGSSAIGMRGGARGVDGGSRHEDQVVLRNMRDAAAAAGQFFANKPIRRLYLGGTAGNVAHFRELLSKQLQSCVAGTFAMDMNAGEHEIREETLNLLQQSNAERERRLVEQMLGSHAQGGQAVLGLDETLQAVSDKRVQTLIISDGYRVPGYVHEPSGFVVANLAKSPMGESDLTHVMDVVDAAVAQTVAQSGHVEVIGDDPRLEDAGRIGAILRF